MELLPVRSKNFIKPVYRTNGAPPFHGNKMLSFLSWDIETYPTINGKVVDNEQVNELCRMYGDETRIAVMKKYINANVSVIIIGFENGIYTCEDFADMFVILGQFLERGGKCVGFNSAKYDDYYLLDWILKHGGKLKSRETERKIWVGGKCRTVAEDNTYNVLTNGSTIYNIEYNYKYYDRHKGKYGTKSANFIDIRLMLGGGSLRSSCRDFGVYENNDMEQYKDLKEGANDYLKMANGGYLAFSNYLYHDGVATYRLYIKFFEMLKHTLKGTCAENIDLTSCYTAAGLAKTVLWQFMFKTGDKTENNDKFKSLFPISDEDDKLYREGGLYAGAFTGLNPIYRKDKSGTIYKNKPIFHFDYHSSYPSHMKQMKLPDIETRYKSVTPSGCLDYCIVHINAIQAHLKANRIPCYNSDDHDEGKGLHDEIISKIDWLLYYPELQLLKEYYIIDEIDIDFYECFEALPDDNEAVKGLHEYIATFYYVKSTAPNKGVKACAKLFLNSSYGKFSERPHDENIIPTLDNEIVAFNREDKNASPNGNVIIGANITMGRRVAILHDIATHCDKFGVMTFLYADTDSIFTFDELETFTWSKEDKKHLDKWQILEECGKFGAEDDSGKFNAMIILAKKTYITFDYETGYSKDGASGSKGVNKPVLIGEILKGGGTRQAIENVYTYGKKFEVNSHCRVRGGVLIFPNNKYLCEGYGSYLPVEEFAYNTKADEVQEIF